MGRGNALSVRSDGQTLVFEPGSPEDLLRELIRLLQRYDPDLILTDHGDSFLIPSLLQLSQRWRVPLPFDREPTPIRRAIVTEGRSYFTYGQIVYNAPDYPFFGRLHIDRENSFFYSVTGFEGIVEAARLSKIPLQRLARRGSGTAISSMQLDRAIQDGILIPWRKGEPEKFKTALDLLVADKGGLTFQPVMGMHDHVAEIDFSSMYPTIMVQHNISAETILCPCCPDPKVPEAGYNICEKTGRADPQDPAADPGAAEVLQGADEKVSRAPRRSSIPGGRRPSSGSWWSASATWGTGTPASGGSRPTRR